MLCLAMYNYLLNDMDNYNRQIPRWEDYYIMIYSYHPIWCGVAPKPRFAQLSDKMRFGLLNEIVRLTIDEDR